MTDQPLLTRAALAYIALTGVVVGVWALGFPRAFYDGFPGFGHMWVSSDGPYNLHLIRDAGAAYAMTAALAGLGLLRPALAPSFAVGFGTLAFNLPHCAYHLTHLGRGAGPGREHRLLRDGAHAVVEAARAVGPPVVHRQALHHRPPLRGRRDVHAVAPPQPREPGIAARELRRLAHRLQGGAAVRLQGHEAQLRAGA